MNLEVCLLRFLGINTLIKIRHNFKLFTAVLRANSETYPLLITFRFVSSQKVTDRINKNRTATSAGFNFFSACTHTHICLNWSVIWPQVKESKSRI